MATQVSVRPNYGPAPKGKANIIMQGQTEGMYGMDSKAQGVVPEVTNAAKLGKGA